MKYYTGIGSRKTPTEIQKLMKRFAGLQCKTLRSGGADGADMAFQQGCEQALGEKTFKCPRPEIYLPWSSFNKGKSVTTPGIHEYTEDELKFADYVLYRAFPVLNVRQIVRSLFRRDVFQVTGKAHTVEDTKCSEFVLCWTPDGCTTPRTYTQGVTGGTGIAICVAFEFDVPVFNLQRQRDLDKVVKWCEQQEKKHKLSWNTKANKHIPRR